MPRAEDGFTLIELLIVVALIGILAAIGAPMLLAAKISANEASAISTLRAVNSAQATYAASCGSQHYTDSIMTLVSNKYMSDDGQLPTKSGFAFVMNQGVGTAGPVDCQAGPTFTSYYMAAEPLSFTSGHRAFATNSGATIWEDTSGAAAPAEPFTITTTVSPVGQQ
jgi:prepilin-type N-terminal cleavage/methylation domain-containing protein